MLSYDFMREELMKYVSDYEKDLVDRKTVLKRIDYYSNNYGFGDGSEIINLLNAIDRKRGRSIPTEPTKKEILKDKAFVWIVVIIFVLCLVGVGKWLINFFQYDGPEYETIYNDENGNGKLDSGEGNYTVDEDGNVVDWDEDANNFE